MIFRKKSIHEIFDFNSRRLCRQFILNIKGLPLYTTKEAPILSYSIVTEAFSRLSPYSFQSYLYARSLIYPRYFNILGGVYRLSFFLCVVHRNIPHFFFSIKVPHKIELDHPFSYLLYILISFDRLPTISLPTIFGYDLSALVCSLFYLKLSNVFCYSVSLLYLYYST